MKNMSVMIVAGGVLALGAPALAGDVDIGARVDGNRVQTWKVDKTLPEPERYVEPKRVFEGELDELGGVVEGDEPGWYFDVGNPFGGWRVGFNILKAARKWDPNGPSNAPNANFQQISPVTFTIGNATLGQATTPAADPASPVAGPSILVPGSQILDFHYPFTMNGNQQGIYLLELESYSNRPNTANSLPFWIVLNYGLPAAELERAEEYVSEFVVPAPGAAATLALAGVLAARRRRA